VPSIGDGHSGVVTEPPSLAGLPVLAELAQLARLDEDDDEVGRLLDRLVGRAPELVPGCTAAGLTVTGPDGGVTAAFSDPRVERCHAAQFRPGGDGPARETLRHAEPRRVDDVDDEPRWPEYCAAARAEGFLSCLALPLLPHRVPAAALNLYAGTRRVFAGTTHDIALLFALQGGVALDDAELYRRSAETVTHLHRTLTTRSTIERAKGMLMGAHGITGAEAFAVLREESQRSHRKLVEVAEALLHQADPQEGTADMPWTPVRH
jgi:GAF domain-containing protein